MAIETDLERYADPRAFAREVNLPLLGVARLPSIPSGASLATLLAASAGDGLSSVVDGLTETRQSLTLRTLLLAGFPHDPECFAVGLALGREWSRRGLRVAVVDLDFWNPTVLRPGSHPNEGFVDVLEYGCSIARVAWEIVADRLWLVGPGSHPPDEERIVDHPDWSRATRVLGMHADVTLFVAPLLDRRGFTGKLSKRVDGALLVASVDRTTRADLRDAFLELWGSDAPMIGCVGIEPVLAAPAEPRGRVPAALPEPSVAVHSVPAAAPAAPAVSAVPVAPAVSAAPAVPSVSAAAAAAAPADIDAGASSPTAVATEAIAPPRTAVVSPEERALEQELDREVRRGLVKRASIPGAGKAAIWIGVAAAIVVGIGIFQLTRTPGLGPGAVIQSQPAGEEAVRPAAPPIQAGLAQETTDLPATGTSPDAGRPAASQPVETPPASAPPASAPPKVDPSLPFSVHVASFRSEAKVQEIVRTLVMKGLDAWHEPAPDMPGWHRVFVGHFATEPEAKAYAGYLLENRFVDRANTYPSTAR